VISFFRSQGSGVSVFCEIKKVESYYIEDEMILFYENTPDP